MGERAARSQPKGWSMCRSARQRSMRPSAAAPAGSRGHASGSSHHSATCSSRVSPQPSVGPAACLILELSFDEVEVLGYQLSDPLQPQLAVYRSSSAHCLRDAMQRILSDLRLQYEEAKAFAVSAGSNCEGFRAVAELHLGDGSHDPPFCEHEAALAAMTPARWKVLGNLFNAQSLPHLWIACKSMAANVATQAWHCLLQASATAVCRRSKRSSSNRHRLGPRAPQPSPQPSPHMQLPIWAGSLSLRTRSAMRASSPWRLRCASCPHSHGCTHR